MSDDAPFLAAIKAALADDAPRLIYADWLDEQGRPGGDFLRLECRLSTLDPATEQRGALLAQLRMAGLGLDEHWMATVSRVPIAEITVRLREIQSWLQRRVTVAEMLAKVAELDWLAPPKSLWGRIRGLLRRKPDRGPAPEPEGSHARAMREWAEANLRLGDEVWEYDTGRDSWANLCGEMGYAIVRNGKVVEFTMLLMN
jgi:uncharacterized protein (TIGR02996 family)